MCTTLITISPQRFNNPEKHAKTGQNCSEACCQPRRWTWCTLRTWCTVRNISSKLPFCYTYALATLLALLPVMLLDLMCNTLISLPHCEELSEQALVTLRSLVASHASGLGAHHAGHSKSLTLAFSSSLVLTLLKY